MTEEMVMEMVMETVMETVVGMTKEMVVEMATGEASKVPIRNLHSNQHVRRKVPLPLSVLDPGPRRWRAGQETYVLGLH